MAIDLVKNTLVVDKSTPSDGGTPSTSSGGGTSLEANYTEIYSDDSKNIVYNNYYYIQGNLIQYIQINIDQDKLEYQRRLLNDTNFMNLLGSSPQVFIKTMNQMVKQLAGPDAHLLINGTIYDNHNNMTWRDLIGTNLTIEKNSTDKKGDTVFEKIDLQEVFTEDLIYDFLNQKSSQESKQDKKYTNMLENKDYTCDCLLVEYNPPIELKDLPMPNGCSETVKTIKDDIGELNFYHHFLVIAIKKISATNIELTTEVVSDLFEYLRHVVKQIIQDLNFEFRESLNTKLNLNDEEKKLFYALNVELQQRSKEYVNEIRKKV